MRRSHDSAKALVVSLMADFDRKVYCVLGLPFEVINKAGAVERVRKSARDRTACFIATPNLNWLRISLTDDHFRNSVIHSDLIHLDGMPLVWIAWLLRVPIKQRLTGSDLFEALRKDSGKPLSVFFFGGPEGAAEAACRRLREESSGLTCGGFLTPGYVSVDEMSSDETIARINASNADFLVVSLGAAKGQAWIERNRQRLTVPVVSHLGSVVNLVAGTLSRAPHWMRRMGLEWLWRIKEEPELWRRYASDARALAVLAFTRVLPLAWYLWRRSPSAAELNGASVDSEAIGDFQLLRLRGAWRAENLAPLRQALFVASRSPRNIRLDMADVSYVDSAFLGLLLLLHALLKQQKKALQIVTVQPAVRRMFKYSLIEHLLLSPA